MDREIKGIWIPIELWLDKELNALEKVILFEIDSLDNSDEHCYASNEHIASFCQCSAWKVSQAISKLSAKGYISVISSDGRHRTICSNLSERIGHHLVFPKAAMGKTKGSRGKTKRQPLDNPKAAFGNPQESNNSEKNREKNREEDINNGGGITLNPFVDAAATAAPLVPDPLVAYAANNLLPMSPANMDELISFRDPLPDALIQHAIDVACGSGKRWYNYVKSILNRYVEMGFRTVAEVEAYEEERKKRKGGNASGEHRGNLQEAPQRIAGETIV